MKGAEDFKSLKDVLERVETKLTVVKNIHIATAFVYWEAVLATFYLIIMLLKSLNPLVYVAYWVLATFIYYPLWSRSKRVFSTYSKKSYIVKATVIAAIVCIPLFNFTSRLLGLKHAIGIIVLCAVSIYLFSIAVMIKRKTGRFPKEMIPAIMSFAFAPLTLISKNPIYTAGYVVIVTYSLTALLYLAGAIGVILES